MGHAAVEASRLPINGRRILGEPYLPVVRPSDTVASLRGAINPFHEQNLDSPTGASADFTKEVEAGVTGAVSHAFSPKVAAGIEARAAGEQQGADPDDPEALQHVLRVGPALWANLARRHFFVVGTALFGPTEYSDAISTTLVLGVR